MGDASSVALGIAYPMQIEKWSVWTGDGAAIMHMGAFAIIRGKTGS